MIARGKTIDYHGEYHTVMQCEHCGYRTIRDVKVCPLCNDTGRVPDYAGDMLEEERLTFQHEEERIETD